MPSELVNAHTRDAWRKLGFYYRRSDDDRRWELVGSPAGLANFAEALDRYTQDPRNEQISEHEHYGPYMNLKIMTAEAAAISDDGISAALDDLRRLRVLFMERLARAGPGASFTIGPEYSDSGSYSIHVSVQPDGFDPASADPELRKPAS